MDALNTLIKEPDDSQSGGARKLELAVFFGCFFYFAYKVFYFATHIRERVFPDEFSWFGIVGVFSRSHLFPSDSPESFPLGLVSHVPNLYFFIMGKVLSWNLLPVSDLVFLRLVNGALALATITIAWLLVCKLSNGTAVRLLFMVMLTNTMMFTFISGAVNYDNLANFLAVSSLYYLVRFAEEGRPRLFLFFCGVVLAGTLTKIVFIPYSVTLLIVCICHGRIRKAIGACLAKRAAWTIGDKFLVMLCLLLGGFNLYLYGGNFYHYGQLSPRMDQVLSVENSMKNRLFARDYIVRQYKTGKIDQPRAQQLALQIRDPGDRDFAWKMLNQVQLEKKDERPERLGRVKYTLEWARFIAARTYGVAAHFVISKGDSGLHPYYAVFLLAGFLSLFRFRAWGLGPYGTSLLFICGFYLLILVHYVNYATYLNTGFVGLALTGRYLFPILVPMYFLVAYLLMDRKPKWWKNTVGVIVSAIFILGEFPWFLANADAKWFF